MSDERRPPIAQDIAILHECAIGNPVLRPVALRLTEVLATADNALAQRDQRISELEARIAEWEALFEPFRYVGPDDQGTAFEAAESMVQAQPGLQKWLDDRAEETEAAQRLRDLMPLLTFYSSAFQLQNPQAELQLGILAYSPDGKSGRVGPTWELGTFLDDLKTLFDEPFPEDDDGEE